MITSAANSHVKLMRSLGSRKTRNAERAFLVEGRRLVEDAIGSGVQLQSLLIREDISSGWVSQLGIDPVIVHVVESSVFNASSELEHSQGVAAICHLPGAFGPEAFTGNALLIIDQVRDPGNMGTILRSGAAAGIGAVLVTPGSVDPYAPKVVRSGMGAHFRLNIGVHDDTWSNVIRESAMAVVLADMKGDCDYDVFDWTQSFTVVVGGETEAFSPVLVELEHVTVRIPMARNVESLNAGVAGSILMFEAARQRRNQVGPG